MFVFLCILSTLYLISKNKTEIVELRELCSDLQLLFVNFGIFPDSEFSAESEQNTLWQTMVQDLREVGIVETLPQGLGGVDKKSLMMKTLLQNCNGFQQILLVKRSS